MTATDRLDAMQQRCDAAAEGPWSVDRVESSVLGEYWVVESPNGVKTPFAGCSLSEVECVTRPDAEFIAAARTDLPATIAAIRDVLDLHGAVHATWATKTGVGPFPFACEECSDVMWVPHPCPTVRAITEALT